MDQIVDELAIINSDNPTYEGYVAELSKGLYAYDGPNRLYYTKMLCKYRIPLMAQDEEDRAYKAAEMTGMDVISSASVNVIPFGDIVLPPQTSHCREISSRKSIHLKVFMDRQLNHGFGRTNQELAEQFPYLSKSTTQSSRKIITRRDMMAFVLLIYIQNAVPFLKEGVTERQLLLKIAMQNGHVVSQTQQCFWETALQQYGNLDDDMENEDSSRHDDCVKHSLHDSAEIVKNGLCLIRGSWLIEDSGSNLLDPVHYGLLALLYQKLYSRFQFAKEFEQCSRSYLDLYLQHYTSCPPHTDNLAYNCRQICLSLRADITTSESSSHPLVLETVIQTLPGLLDQEEVPSALPLMETLVDEPPLSAVISGKQERLATLFTKLDHLDEDVSDAEPGIYSIVYLTLSINRATSLSSV